MEIQCCCCDRIIEIYGFVEGDTYVCKLCEDIQ